MGLSSLWYSGADVKGTMEPEQNPNYVGKGLILKRLAEAALEEYGLRGARFDLLKGFQGKHLFRVVSAEKGEFLLRMYTERRSNRRLAASFSEEALRSQLLWMEALRRGARLSVPEPIRTTEGALTARASAEGTEDRNCLLLGWVPGEHKVPKHLTPDDLRIVGAYAARLHLHAERFSVPEGFVRPTWNWGSLFAPSARIWHAGSAILSEGEMKVLSDTAKSVQETLRELGTGGGTFGMIHRDLQPENLVFDGERVSAIDFEGCGWGYYLYDLAVLLLRLEESGERYEPLRAALLEGYQQVRYLPEEHLDTFVAMRRVDRITRVLRLAKPMEHSSAHELLHGSVEKLEKFTKGERSAANSIYSWLRDKFGR